MSILTLTACAFVCAMGFSYFVAKIYFIHTDWAVEFEKFKNEYFPTREERYAHGNHVLEKMFYQWIAGQYFGGALTGYGLYFLITEILEKVL
jgi:hypothetical protein